MKVSTFVFVLLLIGTLAACQSTTPTARSGFLGDYSKLKSDPNFDNALRWANPAKPVKQYRKFMLDPVIVHFAPNAEGTAIDPGELKKLTDYFHDQAAKALSKQFQVVSQPGPGVLRIRVAITGIEKTIPILNIHPGTRLTGAGLGGASMEGEAIDSVSGERIVAIMDSRRGNRASFGAGLET